MIGSGILSVIAVTAAVTAAAIGSVIFCFGSAGNPYGRGMPGSTHASHSYPPADLSHPSPAGDYLTF
jgi:hypothetical protein